MQLAMVELPGSGHIAFDHVFWHVLFGQDYLCRVACSPIRFIHFFALGIVLGLFRCFRADDRRDLAH